MYQIFAIFESQQNSANAANTLDLSEVVGIQVGYKTTIWVLKSSKTGEQARKTGERRKGKR